MYKYENEVIYVYKLNEYVFLQIRNAEDVVTNQDAINSWIERDAHCSSNEYHLQSS